MVVSCFYPARQEEALVVLERLEVEARPKSYPQLLGRVEWMKGLAHAIRGDLTESQDELRRAQASFEATRDAESVAWILVKMAENLHFLGDRRAAWRDRLKGMAML